MKIKTAVLAVAVIAVLGSGCRKNNTETQTPSLAGAYLSASAPMFARLNQELTFATGIDDLYTSDKTDAGTLGIYWQVNGDSRDTTSKDITKSNPPFTYIPKTAGTYTVTATVFALNGKYYSTSASSSFQAIDPDTAIDGLAGPTEAVKIDDTEYQLFAAAIGDHTWMCQNMFSKEKGRAFQGCEVVSALFGRYYTWEEAQNVCPEGWRLPTAAEFDQDLGNNAGDLMANVQFLEKAMWPHWPEVVISNLHSFNALPVGYMDLATSSEAYGYKEYACWWTADSIQEGEESLGVFRYIFCEEADIKKGKGDKNTLALNVRCVKKD